MYNKMIQQSKKGRIILFPITVIDAIQAGEAMRDLLAKVAEIDLNFGWQARFWAKVDVGGPDDCWNWTASKSRFGHGTFKVRGRLGNAQTKCWAHRIAYELVHGSIPDKTLVCHSCDNPACINPRHLWLGSQADNNRDSWNKGRRTMPPPPTGEMHARGERIGNAKLTAEQARMIVASGLTHAALARQLGVSDMAIRNVRKGVTWGHVTGIINATV